MQTVLCMLNSTSLKRCGPLPSRPHTLGLAGSSITSILSNTLGKHSENSSAFAAQRHTDPQTIYRTTASVRLFQKNGMKAMSLPYVSCLPKRCSFVGNVLPREYLNRLGLITNFWGTDHFAIPAAHPNLRLLPNDRQPDSRSGQARE
jgi:hypothetical protein